MFRAEEVWACHVSYGCYGKHVMSWHGADIIKCLQFSLGSELFKLIYRQLQPICIYSFKMNINSLFKLINYSYRVSLIMVIK